MKVAWLFSGLPRNCTLCSVSLLPLIYSAEATVFAHLWTTTETGGIHCQRKIYSPNPLSKKRPLITFDLVPMEEEIELFKGLYNPKNLITEPCLASLLEDSYKAQATKPIEALRYYRSYYGQLSVTRSLAMVPDISQYDIVVKCRTDIGVRKKELETLVLKDTNTLHVVGDMLSVESWANDTMYYGSPEVMRAVMSLSDVYWNLDTQAGGLGVTRSFEHPSRLSNIHSMLALHCRNLGIPIIKVARKSGRKA